MLRTNNFICKTVIVHRWIILVCTERLCDVVVSCSTTPMTVPEDIPVPLISVAIFSLDLRILLLDTEQHLLVFFYQFLIFLIYYLNFNIGNQLLLNYRKFLYDYERVWYEQDIACFSEIDPEDYLLRKEQREKAVQLAKKKQLEDNAGKDTSAVLEDEDNEDEEEFEEDIEDEEEVKNKKMKKGEILDKTAASDKGSNDEKNLQEEVMGDIYMNIDTMTDIPQLNYSIKIKIKFNILN